MLSPSDAAILPSDSGVLLIGHGTRDEDGHREFLRLGAGLAEALAPLPVELSLLELQPPRIADAWDRLVASGVRQVLAAPLLLFAAGHAKSDIPDELAACQSRHPGIAWSLARPLSRAPELIQLVARRWWQAIDDAGADPDQTAVIVVGRGSHDPCAQADLRVLAECVRRRCPVRRVAIAFYAMAEPKLDQAIAAVVADPEVRHVIIQPHLLFQGAIHRALLDQVAAARARNPDQHFTTAGYLGPDPLVVAALIRRIAGVASRPTGVGAVEACPG